MKHIIITRMKFHDRELLKTYLTITKEILIPQLKNQTNKNFVWGLLIMKRDVEFVREFLEIDFNFVPFHNKDEFVSYVKDNNFDIQTRHDMDDYMSTTYVEKIQEIYTENIKNHDAFLIQSQPIKYEYKTGREIKMGLYHDKRTSMFLSVCQKGNKYTVFDKQHGQMYQILSGIKIISLPEGYTKWVIHGNNISCRRNKKTTEFKKNKIL